ncbi:MAG: Ig-like domain-containing protein [Candidatus Berkelbacteria bacterium]|nr:Ig-like domain-containing protein [Candidatus Berkelbacteria bacterium]
MMNSKLSYRIGTLKRFLNYGLCALLSLQVFLFYPAAANAGGEPVINPISVTAAIDKAANDVAGTIYTNDQRPVIAATFTAGTNPIDPLTAILRNNSIPNPGTTTRDASGISYTPSSNLAENTYAITVDVKDDHGVAATRVSKTVIVDIVAPSVPTISSPASGISNNNTPTISGTADTNSTVNVYDGADPAPVATGTATGGSYSVTTSALSGGAHTLTTKATDYAGNVSAASTSITYTVDTIPPAVNAGSDKTVNAANFQDATASDASGIASYAWSKVSGPGTVTFSTPAAEDTNISADINGLYVLRLTVIDNAGNPASDDMNFTWDSTAPVVIINPIISPSSNTAPTITGTASDAYSNIVSVEYRTDGGSFYPAAASDGTFDSSSEDYTLTTTTLGNGSHTIEVKATNALGNVATSGFVNRSFVVDTANPIINITAPTTGTVLTGATANITWNATDDGSDIAANTVDLAYSTGGAYTDIATGQANSGSYTWTLPIIDNSNVTIRIRATDNASNTGEAFSGTFTIDRVAPAAPTGSILPASPTRDDTPTVTGTVDGQTASVQVNVGSTPLTVTPISGSYTANFTTIADGTYAISAVAIDIHGNASTATTIAAAYQIDTAAPVFVPGSQVPTSTNNSRTTIEGTYSETGSGLNTSTVDLTIDGWYSVPASDVHFTVGHFVYQPEFSFDDGSYDVAVSVSDTAGNPSAVTSWSFTVSSAPTITSVTPVGGTVVAGNVNSTNTSVNVVGTVPADDLGIQTVEIYLDGAPFSAPQTTLVLMGITSFSASISGTQLAQLKGAQGMHTLSARRTGFYGNPSIPGNVMTINTDTIAPTLSSTALSSPINNSSKNNVSLTISGEANAAVNYSIDDALNTPPTSAITGMTTLDGGGNATISGIDVSTLNDSNLAATVTLSDAAGNTSTPGTDTKLKDTLAPTMAPISIASNNANTALAKVGDTVTLSFTSSETITLPTVMIAGNTVTPTNTGGNNYTATYAMQSSDTPGTVSLSISGFADLSGNIGSAVTVTSDASSVLFDQTPPELSTVTIASNNPHSAWAKTGDTVTLTIGASENIQTPTVTIAGHSVSASGSGTSYSATYTMQSSDAEIAIPFSVNFADLAGNSGTAVSATTNASSVTFDKTAPVAPTIALTSPVNNSNKTNAAISGTGEAGATYNYFVSDGINPLQTGTGTVGGPINITGLDLSSFNDGPITASMTLTDMAGNTSAAGTSIATKDTSTPTLSPVTIASSNADNTIAKVGDTVTLNITSSESITTPTVAIVGQTALVSGSGTSHSATYTLQSGDTEGIVTFQISGYSDANGNPGATVSAVTNASSVLFDRTAPSMVSTSPLLATNNPSIPVAATWSDAGSGFAGDPTRTMNIGVPVDTDWNAGTKTMSYTPAGPLDSGTYNVTATIADKAGNVGTTSWSFTPDTIPPTRSIQINSGALYTNTTAVTLSPSATDNIAMSKMAFSNDDATYTTWEDYATTKSYTLPAGNGSKTIYVKYQDAATNESTHYSASITLDTSAPTVDAGTDKIVNAATLQNATASDTYGIASWACRQINL